VKKLLTAVILALLPVATQAAVCTAVAACATTPCAYATAGNWDCGHAPDHATTDTAVVPAGRVVILSTDGQDNDGMTIDGTFMYDEATTGRDGDGFRTMTVTGDITINSTGTFKMRASDRLAFDSTAALRTVSVSSGGLLDIQGEVLETTIATIVRANDSIPLCASAGDPPGLAYTITPAAYATRIKGAVANAKRRVVFESGKARDRHYEIRVLNGTPVTSFNVCTDLPDTDSGTATTGGQRLTAHANRNFFCTGGGTPEPCCTGVGTGACPNRPLSVHSMPTPSGNTACSANETPYGCCTGAGTGTCIEALPAVGDKIAIVNDAWIFTSAGTNGYTISAVDVNPVPIFRAVNFANAGNLSSTNTVVATATNDAVVAAPLEFVNYHDYGSGIDGMVYSANGAILRWNAFHDVRPGAQSDTQATLAVNASGTGSRTASNVLMTDNIFYRTQGVGPHINEGGAFEASNSKFLRNIIWDTCVTRNSECAGLQIDNCKNCEVADNLIYDIANGAGSAGNSAFGAGTGLYFHHNWITNVVSFPLATCCTQGSSTVKDQSMAATHNYYSHSRYGDLRMGKFYSNIIRDIALQPTTPIPYNAIINNPVVAMGNYLLGVEAGIRVTADCTTAYSCTLYGIKFTNLTGVGNDNKAPVSLLDNIIAAPNSTAPDEHCVVVDGSDLEAGGDDVDYNINIDHLTCDGRGLNFRPIGFWQNVTPSPAITVNIRDFAFINNNAAAATCTAQSGITEAFGTGYSRLTAVASEDGAAAGANCASGTPFTRVPSLFYVNSAASDYNLTKGVPALTAGTFPAGSALGSRAFRFNFNYWAQTWGGVVTFDGEQPANVANGVSNLDSDGDGVMDIHDNCPRDPNPNQAANCP